MIRLLQIDDYAQIIDLWKTTPGIGLNERDDSEEGIAKFIARNQGCSFVAQEDGKVVGTILCGHDGRRAIVYHLAIAQNCRRKGIAGELVAHVLEALNTVGIEKVKAIVFADNETGHAFWSAVGWKLREDIHYFDKSVF